MRYFITLIFILLCSVSFSQIIDLKVDEIRGTDTTEGGCANFTTYNVRTTGVVYGRNFGQSQGRIQFALFDKTSDTLLSSRSGIGLFKPNQTLPVTLNEGDSIRVVGVVTCFFGVSQINIDSVFVFKNGSQLVTPKVVQTLNEVTESSLVKMKNMEFISANWQTNPTGSGFTAKAFKGTPGTTDYTEFDIRIDNDCDLFGASMPTGKVDITGIGGQFDNSKPRNEGYQLLPRSASDVIPTAPTELPIINFQDTVYTVNEGNTITVSVVSNSPSLSQISCLVVNQDITTSSGDYSIQQPQIVTFPVNTNTSNFNIAINTDSDNESDEEFLIKLRKSENTYNLGPDTISKIRILGTTSVKKIVKLDVVKINGEFSLNIPENFKGQLKVYNNMGQVVLMSNNNINNDIKRINNLPFGIYRIDLYFDNKKLSKTIMN